MPRARSEAIHIRRLDRAGDAAAVRALFERAADYVAMESGGVPDDATVQDFFTDCAPGTDPAAALKLGLFLSDRRLVAIADLCFGFPEPTDAYLGLMLFDRAWRGRGLGPRFLDHVAELARAEGATRLLLAVFEENARGRAFWERQGFRVVWTALPARIGSKLHVRHRMERRL